MAGVYTPGVAACVIEFLAWLQGCGCEVLVAPAVGVVQAASEVELGALVFAGKGPAQGVFWCDGDILGEPLQIGHGFWFSPAGNQVERLEGCASLDLLYVAVAPLASSGRLVGALSVSAVADVMF